MRPNAASLMIRYAATAFAGICGGVALGAPNAAPPNFSPNPSVSWLVALGGLKPPASGAGRWSMIRRIPRSTTISSASPESSRPFRLPISPIRSCSLGCARHCASTTKKSSPERRLWSAAKLLARGVPGWSLEEDFSGLHYPGPKEVIMVAQADNHQQRHIYLNVLHSPNVKPSWFGESVGTYEGDTLVVDTIGITTKAFVDDYQTPHTDKLHVVERYRMTDGGKAMEARVHVEDPGAFTMPWDAVQRYKRVEPIVAENIPPVENDATSAVGRRGRSRK